VAYRGGPMRFLAHPELNKDSGKGSEAYGIQDQIAGVKRVKENIDQVKAFDAYYAKLREEAGTRK